MSANPSAIIPLIERLKAARPTVERIETKGPLGLVCMQRLNGATRWQLIQIQNEAQGRGKKSIPPALIVALALCNEDGTPAFAELTDAITALDEITVEALDELYEHALRITGLGKKSLEDAEKKSSSSQSSESGTTSPSSSALP